MKWTRAFGLALLCLALLVGSIGCATNDESPQDGQRTDTTAPSSPTSLTKTTPDNDNTPTFTWNAATDDDTGIAGYLVRIDGGEWTSIGDVTTFTCENAVSDGSHALKVKAVDKAGNEGDEGSLAFTCDTVAPTISNVSVASTSPSSATITWTTNESATSQVEYGTTSDYGSSSALHSSLMTTHTVTLTGLTAETTYHYRVKSKDACGNEASSNDNTFTTVWGIGSPDDTPPSIPTGLVLSTGTTIDPKTGDSNVWVKAVWNNSTDDLSGVAFYKIEYWIPGAVHGQDLIPAPSSGTPFALYRDCIANTLYSVKIAAVDMAFNPSDFCLQESITSAADTTAPAIPTGLTAIGVVAGIRLTWTVNAALDLSDYILYINTSNNPSSATEIWRGKGTSYVDGTGSYGVNYYYWLAAIDTSGNLSSKSTLASGCPIQPGYVSTVGVEVDSITIELPSS
jgi:hypothetical protein